MSNKLCLHLFCSVYNYHETTKVQYVLLETIFYFGKMLRHSFGQNQYQRCCVFCFIGFGEEVYLFPSWFWLLKQFDFLVRSTDEQQR